MGRANRKASLDAPSSRIFPRGAAENCLRRAPLFGDWRDEEIDHNYSRLPQGPPLEEDGEENPEAQEIASMALGQVGHDALGGRYQLLGWSLDTASISGGYVPQELYLRDRTTGVLFSLPGQKRETLVRDSVSYPQFALAELADYAKAEGRSADWMQGLLLMKERGFWDMQVRENKRMHTQISSWIVHEHQEGMKWVVREIEMLPSLQLARQAIETASENVETLALAKDWWDRYHFGSLPPVENLTDKLRQKARAVLLGESSGKDFYDWLLQKAYSRSPSEAAEMRNLALRIRDLCINSELPSLGSDKFIDQVCPLWRRVNQIQLDASSPK